MDYLIDHAAATRVEVALSALYDEKANEYLSWMNQPHYPTVALRYLDDLCTSQYLNLRHATTTSNDPNLPQRRILELGCGGGQPVTQNLVNNGASVTAVDLSAEQIKLAVRNVPKGAQFINASMTKLSFLETTFDAVVSMYCIFHLTLDDQRTMMDKAYAWLKPGGCLLINFADTKTQEAGQWLQWLGGTSFIASAGSEGSREMVKAAGFEIVKYEILMDEQEGKMVCAWIIAMKPERSMDDIQKAAIAA